MSCNSVITISREFGSGGREIASKLAERLNVDFYDKELIYLAAKKSGIDPSVFEKIDERASNSLLYSLSMGMFNFGQTGFSPDDQISVNDQLYLIQYEIIRKLSKNPCVIVGRCADYILKDLPNCISVFIHADFDLRCERAARVRNISDSNIAAVVRKADKFRSNYYRFYTEQKWGLPQNYNLTVNSGRLSVSQTADLIAEYVRIFETESSVNTI